jgi:hypothetical protein
MMQQENEIRRDPEIAAALRMIEGEPPLADVDWEALRSAIVARAELPLAQRRTRSARLARWTRPLIPLAAAASIAMAMWANGLRAPEPVTAPIADGNAEIVAPAVTTVEDAFQADVTEQEFRLLVSGRANADALLMVALDGG